MTIPSAVTKTHLDSASDDPAQARAELAAGIDAINAIRTHLATSTLTSGASVLAAAGGLAVSGTDLLTSFDFAAKSANYTALAGDRGKVINFTTAGVTLSLTAAATLGGGWWCIVVNSASTGLVTIDPNESETIDGSTTITLQPGDAVIVLCNGSLFRTVGRRRSGDYFHAHKNGVDQGSIANGGDTKVTFGTEAADAADVFDTSTSRFTPPAGTHWLISAVINTTAGSNDGEQLGIVLYKDGAVYKRGSRSIAGGASLAHGCALPALKVEGDGVSYYEIYAQLNNATGSRTIEGTASDTWFQAVRIA